MFIMGQQNNNIKEKFESLVNTRNINYGFIISYYMKKCNNRRYIVDP